jgi:hypothetical protein
MTVTPKTRAKTGVGGGSGEKVIVAALRKLPADYLPEVLHYIEFLDYKINAARADAAEEAALWAAVEANQAYKRQHIDEGLEVHETGADFLKAVADL